MAFVSKQENRTKNNPSLGPGCYFNQITNHPRTVPAPFNSSLPRNKSQIVITPGPGDYNINRQIVQQGKIITTYNNYKILQPSKPLTIFKSRSQRFTKIKNQTPGPGQYNINQNSIEKKKIYKKQKSSIVEFLMKKNLLVNNLNEIKIGEASASLIINQKNTKTKQKQNKCSAFFESKVERSFIQRPKTTLGPGSYNITQNIKPSSSQARRVKNYSITKIKPQRNSEITLQQQQQKNYLSNVNLGPGYYHNEILLSSFKCLKQERSNQFFGSTIQRFPAEQQQIIGPTTYNPDYKIEKSSSSMFKSKLQRFSYNKNNNNCLSPFTYQPLNDFRQLLAKNMKKGSIGNFGSKSKRFDLNKNITPGPGQYLSPTKSDEKKQNSVTKQKKNQKIMPQRKQKIQIPTPAPGSYQLSQYNISSKIKKRKNDEHCHSPPFMSCQKRFKFNKLQNTNDSNIIQIELKSTQPINKCEKENHQKFVKQVVVPFVFKQSRFKQDNRIKNIPGPGEYINQLKWQIPSFNIMFNSE